MKSQRLEQMLLSEGVLQRSELEAAMAAASGQQKRLALTILEMNLIDERELAEFLSRHTGHPLVEPLPHELPTWVYRRVPGPIARTYFAAPLEVSDRQIKVALLDPTDQAAIDVLATATQMTVVPSVAIHSSLEKFFNRIYPIDVDMDATIVSERSFDAEESTSEPALSETDPSLGTMAIDRSTLNQENPVIEPEQPTAPPERPAQKGSLPDYRAQLEEIWRAVRALQDDVRELKKHRERKPFL